MTHSDLLAICSVLGVALAMLGTLALCRRLISGPEGLRKIAHIGTGLLALPFPWLFTSLKPVLMVCGLSIAMLMIVSAVPSVRLRLGSSLYSVDRSSRGEFYFPISVALLFWLAHGNWLLYVIPLLVLTFADAVAAVLGTIYGKVSYDGMGGKKSLEGSVAFFTVAFFAVHVPLLLFSQLSRPQTLLVALDIALVVTLLEAVAWRGLDNIFIPMGGFLLLHIYTALPLRALVFRFIAAAVLVTCVLLYRSRTTLQASALIASALALYASWGAGGLEWFISPAILFACYSFFAPHDLIESARKDNVYPVASVAAAGLLWLFLAKVNGHPHLIFPYTVAYGAHLAILGWTLSVLRDSSQSPWRRGTVLVFEAWVLIFAPYVWLEGATTSAVECALAALVICAVSFAAFCIIERRHHGLYAADGWRWLRQAALVGLFTVPLAWVPR
jgi:phytol kinase